MAGQDQMRFMEIYNALRNPTGMAQTPRVAMPQPGQSTGWMGGVGQMSPQDMQTMRAIQAMMARQQGNQRFNPAAQQSPAGMVDPRSPQQILMDENRAGRELAKKYFGIE